MVVANRQLQDGSLMDLVTDPEKEVVKDESPASSASGSPSPAPQEPEKKKRAYKKRKATHTIRKEQKAVLEREIAELQDQLEDVKFRALVQQGKVSNSYHDRAVENAVLKESIQEQHFVMAQVRAFLSGQMQVE
ncbi:hypothetical protein PInf_008610 [Phytophthora infestans]|nr:hypothetical protein PInf_008610 [Phytophthora infestans]